VQALEAGNLPLEESIELYRRGLELHAACEHGCAMRSSPSRSLGAA
jgi:exonuclease VII small subunit